jgi:hypothetical protein
MSNSRKWWLVSLALAAALAAGVFWWQKKQIAIAEQPAPAVLPAVVAPAAPINPPAPEVSLTAPAPIQHPIEIVETAERKKVSLPTLEKSDSLLKDNLNELLGAKAVTRFVVVDDFVRRFVATVDNLARGHAASRMWPVTLTPGRTQVAEKSEGIYLLDSNSERFTPFVKLAVSVDATLATRMYARLYPLFQQAYEEQGYPGKYFNDRVVEVIDQLLATPELSEPIKLTLTQVQGPIQSSQPWLRYEFDDPDLEARPAGQKILLRMGRGNADLLKNKLREFRERIVKRKSIR